MNERHNYSSHTFTHFVRFSTLFMSDVSPGPCPTRPAHTTRRSLGDAQHAPERQYYRTARKHAERSSMEGSGATVEDVLEKGAVVVAGGAAAIASSLDVRGPSGTSKVHPETLGGSGKGKNNKKKPRRVRSRVRSIRTKMERQDQPTP